MSEGPHPNSHSAAASALGYLHQTRWGLLELLWSRNTDPSRSLTMEMFDDIAWDYDGTPTELKQLKLHVSTVRNLTDASDDIWRTLRAWMDAGRPGDTYGPTLTLITNATAGTGSAASHLRVSTDRDVTTARTKLEHTARNSTTTGTKAARDQFLRLPPSERATFVGRIFIADQSADLDGVEDEVATLLRPGAPTDPYQFDMYLEQVWGWWAKTTIAMLRGQRPAVSVTEVLTVLERIRDGYTRDNLPSLIDTEDINLDSLQHENRTYVHQLHLLNLAARPLQKAILDYQRAYLQETRWLEVDLVDYAELDTFTARLVDEWERAFDHMLAQLPDEAGDADKQRAGRELLNSLSESALSIRAKFQQPFHARGRRHALADDRKIGWHPEFDTHLAQLLLTDV